MCSVDITSARNRDAMSLQFEWSQFVAATPASVQVGPQPPQALGNETCESRGVMSKGRYDLAELYDLSKPGKYTVQYIYEERQGGWEGKLPSNLLAFEIAAK